MIWPISNVDNVIIQLRVSFIHNLAIFNSMSQFYFIVRPSW